MKIIKSGEYNLLKKMAERQDNYISEIRQLIQMNDRLKLEIYKKENEIFEKEILRKKLAGRIGGMKKNINKLEKQIEWLRIQNAILIKREEKHGQISKKQRRVSKGYRAYKKFGKHISKEQ